MSDTSWPPPAGFGPEPGWTPLPIPRKFGNGRSFVSGDTESDAIRIYYYQRDSDRALCAKLWVGYGAEGPANHAHGGSMAAVLDEAMGFAAWVSGHPVVAASITINFLRSLPLERIVQVEAWVDAVEDTKVSTIGRILDAGDGRRYCEGQGLFIERPIEFFGDLASAKGLAKG